MLDLGDFQGRANGNNNIVNLSRYGFTHSLSQNYKILDFHDKNQNFNEKNGYTSRVVNSGIFFNIKYLVDCMNIVMGRVRQFTH